jgi:hypothetical protein
VKYCSLGLIECPVELCRIAVEPLLVDCVAIHAELDARVTVRTRERHVDALKKSYETVDTL